MAKKTNNNGSINAETSVSFTVSAPANSAKAEILKLKAKMAELEAKEKAERKDTNEALAKAITKLSEAFGIDLATVSRVSLSMSKNNGLIPETASLEESAARTRKVCTPEERKEVVAKIKTLVEGGTGIIAACEQVANAHSVSRQTVYTWDEVVTIRNEIAKASAVAATPASNGKK